MKKVIYTTTTGTLSVLGPSPGARLAIRVVDINSGEILAQASEPIPVDMFFRGWPKEGVEAVWAESEDAFVQRIIAKDVPPWATNVTVIDHADLPVDRYFRNAWKFDAGKIGHDMDKCREIHRTKLREMREPKMKKLDADYMRADEQGDVSTKRLIASQKQALRDVTKAPEIDAAQTPEELKAVLPDILK